MHVTAAILYTLESSGKSKEYITLAERGLKIHEDDENTKCANIFMWSRFVRKKSYSSVPGIVLDYSTVMAVQFSTGTLEHCTGTLTLEHWNMYGY